MPVNRHFYTNFTCIWIVINKYACLVQAGGNKSQSGSIIALNGLRVVRQINAVKYDAVPNVTYLYIVDFQIGIRCIIYRYGRRIVRRNRTTVACKLIRRNEDRTAAGIEVPR